MIIPGSIGPAQETDADKSFLATREPLKIDPFQAIGPAFMGQWTMTTGLYNQGMKFAENFRDKQLTPEQAQERYGIQAPPEGISEEYAKFKYDRQQGERSLQAILDNVDENRFGSTLYPFLSGIAGGILLDPVGIATGAAGVKLLGNLTKGAASGISRFIYEGTKRADTVGQMLKVGLVEGTVESAISAPLLMKDIPDTYDRDYTLQDVGQDAAYNILGNIGFSAVGYGARKFLGRFSKTQQQTINETAMTMAMQGKRPDYSYVEKSIARANYRGATRANVDIEAEYRILSAQEVEFFASFDSPRPNVMDIDSNNVVDFSFGKGLVVTDNPTFAKNAAASPLTGDRGSVLQVSLKDLNILETEMPASEDVKTRMRQVLKSFFSAKEVNEIVDKPTLRQSLDTIDKWQRNMDEEVDFQDAVNDALRDMGYHGYKFKGGMADFEGSAHTAAFLFNPADVKVTGEPIKALPDNFTVPGLESDVKGFLDDMQAGRFDTNYDPVIDAEYDATPTTVTPPDTFSVDEIPEITQPELPPLPDGKTITLFHGTKEDFDTFDFEKTGGIAYFSDMYVAQFYAEGYGSAASEKPGTIAKAVVDTSGILNVGMDLDPKSIEEASKAIIKAANSVPRIKGEGNSLSLSDLVDTLKESKDDRQLIGNLNEFFVQLSGVQDKSHVRTFVNGLESQGINGVAYNLYGNVAVILFENTLKNVPVDIQRIPPSIIAETGDLLRTPTFKYVLKDIGKSFKELDSVKQLDKNKDQVFKAAEFCTRMNQ